MAEKKPMKRILAKKRTGQLLTEEVLFELNPQPAEEEKQPTQQSSSHSLHHSPSRRFTPMRDKKEKKRERWLLTRKTWKYMADAGRKLIPDGVQNRAEDVQKLEKHFHNLCANEPKFILWRRKASYPGAFGITRNSKRRLKTLLSHKSFHIDEETEETRNAEQVIDLLQNFLKLDEARKTTTLLGAKTVRPDQTASPSAQRPRNSNRSGLQSMTMSSRGPGFLPPLAPPTTGIDALSEVDQLLERLRTLSRSTMCRNVIPMEHITPDILENKTLLKQLYNELKKQQLHRILGKHSATSTRMTLPHASSLSSLWNYKRDEQMKTNVIGRSNKTLSPTSTSPPMSPSACAAMKQSSPPNLNFGNLPFHTPTIPVISIKQPSMEVFYLTRGTQTDFIDLYEIERLAKEYKEAKQEEAAAAASAQGCGSGGQPTDDESDKGITTGHGHRRKSSIDNEDISQSVSDTIKRYLRMARKKSVHDDNANRFKYVNYDRNLRNIRAKDEINPPGMDEDNHKAAQTLDAWSVLTLDFIRGNENPATLEEAHLDWQRSLERRIQQKQEYEEKQRAASQYSHSNSSTPAPTSPTSPTKVPYTEHQHSGPISTATGLLHSSTQLLSNLWHGNTHQQRSQQDRQAGYSLPGHNSNSSSSIVSTGTTASGASYSSKPENTAVMQKSKSSSNVGQFVSKKIWKTRSKSQTRTSSPTKAEWTPKGNCTWTSDSGKQITLSDIQLQTLSEVEAKILQRVAIEKINQLNIGVVVEAPSENENVTKSQKRRPLTKKKAMTTSFFDIGRKEDKGPHVGVFGNTLENCVAYDHKRRLNLTATSDRGSRNSITSLFRGSSSSKVRSCENLPSDTLNHPVSDNHSSNVANVDNLALSGTGNLIKAAMMQISRSQSDVRRSSQDCDELQLNNSLLTVPPPMIDSTEPPGNQVPTFVRECIKHLEKYGLHLVGLFRVSTSKKRLRQMRDELDRSSTITIDPETCPHDVATLLKEFLRDLPEPLLCRNLYNAFIKTQKIRNRRLQLEAVSHLVQLLPATHRDTLYVLLKFLAKVASCCDDITSPDGTVQISGNKMDSTNLATVFAPNILRTSIQGDETSEQMSMGDIINVIRTMIDHYEEIFRVPAELMDEIYANMIDTFPEQLNYLCERRNAVDNEDVINTGSSSTPLSSPPPTSDVVTRRPNTISDMPTEGRPLSEPSSHRGPVAPARRIYTREDVMHHNSASKDPTEASSARMRRHVAKSKYSENDSPSSQHRSSIKSISGQSTDNSNTPNKSSSDFYSTHHQQQPSVISTAIASASTKRLSSPYASDQTGVVTASLKIPVQMQTVQGSNGSSNPYETDTDELAYRGSGQFDLSSIPYIEDSNYGNEGNFNEGFAITGSLSFGDGSISGESRPTSTQASGGATVFQIPIQYEGQQMLSPTNIKRSGASSESSSKPSAFLSSMNSAAPSTTTSLTTKSREKSSRKGLKNPPTGSSSQKPASITSISKAKYLEGMTSGREDTGGQSQIEPRLPTSISNIGGAILRSKTADFEKMAILPPDRRSQNASTSTSSIDDREPRGPLYKRQELISSAKRTSK